MCHSSTLHPMSSPWPWQVQLVRASGPGVIQVRVCFTRPSPMLVMQVTNTGWEGLNQRWDIYWCTSQCIEYCSKQSIDLQVLLDTLVQHSSILICIINCGDVTSVDPTEVWEERFMLLLSSLKLMCHSSTLHPMFYCITGCDQFYQIFPHVSNAID